MCIMNINSFVNNIYSKLISIMQTYMPKTRAKIEYYIAYHKKCNLNNPQTFSEKLIWLSLHTYRNNPTVLALCDKYLVRAFVEKKVGKELLNELYYVWDDVSQIHYKDLPNSFALKVSQGCTTNILCRDKNKLAESDFYHTINTWNKKQHIYDKMMADVGGIRIDKLKKYYICEKYLFQDGEKTPIDYKIYCFNGIPRAILVISNRFEKKTGLFMTPDWQVLSELSGHYSKPTKIYSRPESLSIMLDAARKLSKGFPFVRVDMYDVQGKAIFGEMTFFPNGCINLQETLVDGKTMGELLDLTEVMNKNERKNN